MFSVTTKVSAVHLNSDHRDAFSQAIRAILASDLAEITMAQLVDGIPTADIACQTRGNYLTRAHPLMKHEEICKGALEKTQSLRDNFDLDSLYFESSLMRAYSDTEMGSGAFKMRLIEMVAVSLHQIAVALFKLTPKSHTPEEIKYFTEWQRPSRWIEYCGLRKWDEPLFPPPPTHFSHPSYLDFDLYPHGIADVAGYWAEDRILGGVVVFDRGQSGTECKDIFFHSGREGETFRIWRLLESQLAALVDFLLGKTCPQSFPLPLLATDENRYRFDPWDAIALHHIFRDPWERRIPLQKPPERDVISAGDYPEIDALFDDINEVIRREDETPGEGEPFRDRYGSAKRKALSEQAAAKPDRLWIYRHGGHVGEPLGEARLPLIGPPKEDLKPSPSPVDTVYTFDNEFPSPRPFGDDSECVRWDEEALLRESSVSPKSEKLNQDDVDVAEQSSTTNLGTSADKKDDVLDMIVTASETCGQDADDAGMEADNVSIGGSAGPVTSPSPQPQRLSMKRKAEDDPSDG